MGATAQNKKELKALEIILERCMFTAHTDGLSYWLESPLFNGNKLLITKEEYELFYELLHSKDYNLRLRRT